MLCDTARRWRFSPSAILNFNTFSALNFFYSHSNSPIFHGYLTFQIPLSKYQVFIRSLRFIVGNPRLLFVPSNKLSTSSLNGFIFDLRTTVLHLFSSVATASRSVHSRPFHSNVLYSSIFCELFAALKRQEKVQGKRSFWSSKLVHNLYLQDSYFPTIPLSFCRLPKRALSLNIYFLPTHSKGFKLPLFVCMPEFKISSSFSTSPPSPISHQILLMFLYRDRQFWHENFTFVEILESALKLAVYKVK